jgi:hypothetical protein
MLMLVAVSGLILIAGGRAAQAAQPVCVGGPSTALTVPSASGQCPSNETHVALATEAEISALASRVTALEDKLSAVSFHHQGLNGKPTLTIAGANLQVVSGSGSTGGPPNGLGNVIIGYDEHGSLQQQTGSHNLVLGDDQAFTSFGGLIAGQHNTVSAPFSAVFRHTNTANAEYSVVGAGFSTLSIRKRSQTVTLPPGNSYYDEILCQPGAQAVGGGFGLTPGVAASSASYPATPFNAPTVPDGWRITFYNPTGATQTVGDGVYAVCAMP